MPRSRLLAALACAAFVSCGKNDSRSLVVEAIRVPDSPAKVQATPRDAKADVVWTPPSAHGRNALSSNTVTSAPGSVTVTVDGASTNATVGPLLNGTSYTFTVHATNAAGDSPESAPSAPVTPRTVPVAPTITGVLPGDAQVTVSWAPPASDGGSAISGYTVVSSPGGIRKTVGPVLGAAITGLTNGIAYTFTVYASNVAGDGPFSAPSAAVTPRAVPGAPAAVSAVPGNGQATVSWTAPASDGGAAIASYTVASNPGNVTVTVPGTSALVTGLVNGTSYTFTVVATNVVGEGPASAPSAPIVPRTVPDAPTGVTAVADDGRALLSWVAPGSDGGAAITNYLLTASPGGGTMTVGNVLGATFTGLTNGTSYTFTVAAINAAGTGTASASSGPVVPRGVPGAPTSVAAVPGNASAIVTWAAPASNGGDAISSYTVTASPGGATTSVNASQTTATVNGLTNGTTYSFVVFATNVAGNGPNSAPSNAIAPRRPPDAPTNVTAVPGDAQATVSWTAPGFNGGAPITSYTVTATPAAPPATTGGSSTSTPVAGLANGTSYTFSVYATNGAGDGPLSAASAPVTPVSGPAFPVYVSGNGRYLVDIHNRPFRIHGDAAYSYIANLTWAEAQTYVADRQARGFNAILVNLVEHLYAVDAPLNRNGDPPFATAGDFSTPNEAYFAFADAMIDLAASKGMLVFLEYLYLGSNGGREGWYGELTSPANTQAVCYNFGLYLGNRYKNRSNIVWVSGGDYMPPAGSEGEARHHKILEGIRAAGATQLATAHWNTGHASSDDPAFPIDLNGAYEYGTALFQMTRADYANQPSLPSYLLETGYELEQFVPGDPASIRKYEYWAQLDGANAGIFYGHRDIWEFSTDTFSSGFFGTRRWQLALGDPGAVAMTHMRELLDSVAWQNLVPSGLAGMKTLVSGNTTSNGHVAASATPDGTLLLAYVPSNGTATQTATINMTAMSGPSRSRWYDPNDGTYRLNGVALPNTGNRVFTTPGANSAGNANDWVLVLDPG